MIGIVLVTHGNLALEFLAALEHVVGPQQCVSAVCIGAEDDMEKRRSEILERARACDTGDGVIVLTDMFGATPANIAGRLASVPNVRVLCGVNLPMLVRAVCYRATPLDTLVDKALAGATKGVHAIGPATPAPVAPPAGSSDCLPALPPEAAAADCLQALPAEADLTQKAGSTGL